MDLLADRTNQEPQASPSSKAWGRGLTPAQLREAERGLKVGLARRFSAQWIAEHHRDLLAQANAEYLEWLEENPPARNPVGWIINCANWRAINLLDAETRRPPSAPLDAVALRVADESTPTPEQQALDQDRRRRLDDALHRLPEKEQQLLALVYFDGLSIREAGRMVGWGKSAADRHHAAAMEKMAALVGDRRYLSPATLLLILLGAARDAVAVPTRFVRGVLHRLAPFAETAGPVSSSAGAGRVLAQCAAAAGIAICGTLAAPAVDQGVHAVIGLEDAHPTRHHQPAERNSQAESAFTEQAPEPSTASTSARAREREQHRHDRRRKKSKSSQSSPKRSHLATASPVPAPEPLAPTPRESESPPPVENEAPTPPPAGGAGAEFGL
jgi:RNA polymerase sigma factor (sigma-70 family)